MEKSVLIEKHLRDRGVPETAPVFIDHEENMAYFVLFNLSGQIVGLQRYNPEGYKKRGKYYRNIKEYGKVADKNLRYKMSVTRENTDRNVSYIAVYGMHTLDERNFVFVVEGVFDAVKLESLGMPVIALFANNPKKFKNFFYILPKYVIVWRDADKASEQLKSIADFSIIPPPPYKDLGEMPLEEVRAWTYYVLEELWTFTSSTRF